MGKHRRNRSDRSLRHDQPCFVLTVLMLLLPGVPKRLLLCLWWVEWLFKREIEMHRPRPLVGPEPCPLRQSIKVFWGGGIQPLMRATHQRTAHRLKKVLLIHGLIGTALLQACGSISCEQQERLTRAIGFHGSREKVGHSGA